MPDPLPRTRAEAKALGVPRYFSGVPCIHGHTAPRYASSQNCVVCAAERTAAFFRDREVVAIKRAARTPEQVERERAYRRDYQRNMRARKRAEREAGV